MRLLLVEDDVMVASGIKLGLCDAGYTVDWVGSAERALEVTRSETFDLAVIDITAHGLLVREMVDGLDFAELQRLTPVPLTLAAAAAGDTAPRPSAGARRAGKGGVWCSAFQQVALVLHRQPVGVRCLREAGQARDELDL